MAHATFQVGDLTAVVGDNEAVGEHEAGYNGLWSLRHAASDRGLFVPAFAGLNFQRIFDGESHDTPEHRFEPRQSPMTFRRLSELEAELHQPPTPLFRLESWTRFTFVAPHAIDVRYRCLAHEPVFRRGYIGLFWSSFIHAPTDKSLHFLGCPAGEADSLWCQLGALHHSESMSVRHRDDEFDLALSADYHGPSLRQVSRIRYDLPLCYGLFEDLIWLLMFDRPDGIRFTQSAYGGNLDSARRTTNPSWGFVFLIPDYQVGTEYGFAARAVLRPRCSREEVVAEYRRWRTVYTS